MTDSDINLNPKATPGPWHVGVGLMICAEDGSPIARCASTRGKFEFEEANAHVLAAAWELLALCEELLPYAEHESQDTPAMHALIAKAKGGAA